MDDKIDLAKLMIHIQNDYKKTNDIKKSMENIFRKKLEDVKDFADTEKTISELMKSIEPFSTIENFDDNCEIDDILKNTLNQFEHLFENETIKIFKKLSEYDKIITIDETKVFYKIYFILQLASLHKKIMYELDILENENIEKRGIAKTRIKVNEAIQPRINTFNDALKYNNIPSNRLAHEINTSFEKTPREINAMFEAFDISILKNIDKSLVDTFNNQQVFLNSSEPLKDTHIFTSIQIYCFTPYKKENNPDVTIKLTNRDLAICTNQIINDFFEYEYNSNLNRNHISKPIQHKSYFQGVSILEYETPEHKKEHPIFK